MKIQYASDLHLEFPENEEYLKDSPLKPEGDILILAGDIVPIVQMDEHSYFFDFLSDHFKTTWWIPGNHEYYHSDINEIGLFLNDKIRDNVFLVNNLSVTEGDCRFVFSTLWTKIDPVFQFEIKVRYSDFHVIMDFGRTINVDRYNQMHETCLSFLRDELKKEESGKTIVVTHHMPTFRNYPDELRREPISQAFAVELSDFIKVSEPDFWIFGHSHLNQNDFRIGKTQLITNQMGYVMYNEHKRFRTGKTFVTSGKQK